MSKIKTEIENSQEEATVWGTRVLLIVNNDHTGPTATGKGQKGATNVR
jgi:hypothetical protein